MKWLTRRKHFDGERRVDNNFQGHRDGWLLDREDSSNRWGSARAPLAYLRTDLTKSICTVGRIEDAAFRTVSRRLLGSVTCAGTILLRDRVAVDSLLGALVTAMVSRHGIPFERPSKPDCLPLNQFDRKPTYGSAATPIATPKVGRWPNQPMGSAKVRAIHIGALSTASTILVGARCPKGLCLAQAQGRSRSTSLAGWMALTNNVRSQVVD